MGSNLRKVYLVLAFLLVLGVRPAFSQNLAGRTVRVIDGDTIVILTDSHEQIRVRLYGVDAPEKKQAFGSVSKQALSDLVFGKVVRVEVDPKQHDKYGRTIGRVYEHYTDVNLAMVKMGVAWAYTKVKCPSEFIVAQDEARILKKGLWKDESPTPPWDWRKEKHSNPEN